MEQSESKFSVGDRVYSPYTCQEGTIELVRHQEPAGVHGVTGTPLPAEHWYDVRNADGSKDMLSDTRMRLVSRAA